jgi:ABC-type dipeptide/oligopeptide/nickel transport system permease subunit
MITDGKNDLATNPQIVAIPCIVLVITIMALYFAGDKLRQYFDVKEGLL